ncbi:MAG TPA: M20/M25/M40 family metallo-hydrolase [Syntrophorhabdaceae bacterium]|nr:M20/M25/M40 family metallo-hydrolase [Syntrophorhabdaceae bacterium]
MKTFDDAVSIIREFLRIDTTNPPGKEEAAAHFLEDILRREGLDSEIHSAAPTRANIISRIKGREEGKPIVLLGHTDVVPAKEEEWTAHPFGGEVKDGYVYGRGAIDMKAQVICQLIAFVDLAHRGVVPKRDIIFLATCDEEVGGANGMQFMLDRIPELKDASFVLSEGGCLIEENGLVHAQVSVTEKKLSQFVVKAKGTGGHGSMPHGDNANEKIVEASHRILSHAWPLKAMPITSAYLGGILGERTLGGAKFPGVKEALKTPKWRRLLEGNEIYNAILRNTVTLTILKGGEKVNVIPAESSATFDARLLPAETHERFFRKVRRLAGKDVVIERIGEKISEPGPSRYNTVYFQGIRNCVTSLKGQVPVLPFVTTGATDLRYFRDIGVPAYGFFPITLTKEEHMRMHGKDERISLENIREGLEGCRGIVNFLASPSVP